MSASGKSLIVRHGLSSLDANRYHPICLRGNICGEGEHTGAGAPH